MVVYLNGAEEASVAADVSSVNLTSTTFTFNNTDTGVQDLFTVSGIVFVRNLFVYVSTGLSSSGSGEVSIGTTNNTDNFIDNTESSVLTTGIFWSGINAAGGASTISVVMTGATTLGDISHCQSKLVSNTGIVLQVYTAQIQSGVLELAVEWEEVSSGATVVAV